MTWTRETHFLPVSDLAWLEAEKKRRESNLIECRIRKINVPIPGENVTQNMYCLEWRSKVKTRCKYVDGEIRVM